MKLSKYLAALALLIFCVMFKAIALERQPDADYHSRRVALGASLKGGVAILFASDEPSAEYLSYRQDEDFYYLTGWNQPGAAVMIIGASEPAAATPQIAGLEVKPHRYREILFLPTRNKRLELYTGVQMDASSPDAPSKTGVTEVKPMTDLPGIVNELAAGDRRELRKLYVQQDMPQGKTVVSWAATTLGVGADSAPGPGDVRSLIEPLRAVKQPGEVALIRKATDASMVAQRAAIQAIGPDVKENAIAGLLNGTLLAQGCERYSYPPIVGSGANSTVLHYSDDNQVMHAGDLVVMDAAGEYSMYASDITRTMPVSGHFTDRQREIYNIVLGAQRAAAAAFVADKSHINDTSHKYADSLDVVAFNYMNEHGKDLHGQPLGKYFIHGLGHMVGIDVHDPYDYSKPLPTGAVFTIEPGIYIPEEHLGVRIEDVFYASPDGKLVDLVADLPHTAEDIEALMAKHVAAETRLRQETRK
jgi:Xaa-Pro aminopeptidase